MNAIAISNGYITGKVYIVWEIPHDKITGYEVYRDNKLIASSLIEDEEEKVEFTNPTVFDNDHHTNLFRKDSTFKLMYVDENVNKYQTYEYVVVAKRLNESGDIVEEKRYNTITIQAQ